MSGLIACAYLWTREMAAEVTVEREQRFGWVQVGDFLEKHDEGIHWFQALDDPYERIKGVILEFLDY